MIRLALAIQAKPVADAFTALAEAEASGQWPVISGRKPAAVARSLSKPTSRPQWLAALRLRRQAVYLAVVAGNIPQAQLAHTLGLRRQTIHRLVRIVEDERDDVAVDAFLDAITELLP